MWPVALSLVWLAGLSTALLWLLLMATLSARAGLWPSRALLVAGAAPGGALGYAAFYASVALVVSRQAPWGLLVGSALWMLAFSVGTVLLIYHRRRLLEALERPVSTSSKWLLASGTFMLAGLFIADGYSNAHVERLRQMRLFGPPMEASPEPQPKWHFYNRAHAMMWGEREWYSNHHVHDAMRWMQRVYAPGFRLSEGDEVLQRGRERLVELILKATEQDAHEGAPAEFPAVNPQDFLAMAYLLDVDSRLKAAAGASGVARGNRALWQLAIDVLDNEVRAPMLSFMGRDFRDAGLIETLAIKNLEAILDILPDDSPEIGALSVPGARTQHFGRRLLLGYTAITYHAFAAHDWPTTSGPFMATPGGWDPLARCAYRLFLRHHDIQTFVPIGGYYSTYLKNAPLWLTQPDFSRRQQDLLNRHRVGPVTREFDDVASKAVQRLVQTEIASRLAEIGLACRRYHMAKGRYPEALKDLVPEFLEMTPWPPDLVRYRATAAGCVVYSEHTGLHFRVGDQSLLAETTAEKSEER